MDKIFRQLGELALGSIPTVVLFILLYIFYRFLVHKPLARVLEERDRKTTGAVRKAQSDIAAAEQKMGEYEQRLRDARLSIYKGQEARRQRLLQQRAEAVAQARAAAQTKVEGARAELAREALEIKAKLQAEGSSLAAEVLHAVLGQRVDEGTPVGGR